MTHDLHAIINAQLSSEKKKQSCPFSLAKERPKKAKNTFAKERAAKLGESGKGSFNKQEKLLDELDNDHEMNESCSKILLQETVEAEESDKEKWTKLKGSLTVSGKRLQESLGDAVSCCFCQGYVNIMENSHEMDLVNSYLRIDHFRYIKIQLGSEA